VSGDPREIRGRGDLEPVATPPIHPGHVWRAGAAVVLPVLLVLALLALATLRHQQTLAIGAALARGETPPVPDLTLPSFSGAPISLSGLRGHPVILNFWASWCIPCRDEAPLGRCGARRRVCVRLDSPWRTASSGSPASSGVTVRDGYAPGRSGRPGPDSGPRPPNRRRIIGVSENVRQARDAWAGVEVEPLTVTPAARGRPGWPRPR
jgi:hypothetical protein